jgi:tetratricopeptide (TPR) repeat protein
MQIMPDDLGVLAGAAEVELRDNKFDAANELITKALNISKDDVRSQLVQSEISIQKKDYPDARARLNALDTRNPPPSKLDQSRIKLALGKLAEADGKDDEAVELFAKAAELAGDAELTPTLTAVNKYTAMADKLGDNTNAAELRGKAQMLLEKVEKQAEKDPAIALALGSALLRTGDAAKAEQWLYRVVEARPDDAEGHYQIAKALARQDKTNEAVTRLTRAIELAPKRFEFQVELARTYERAHEDQMAGAIYNRLLADAKDAASVELRAAAGLYFARLKQYAKAGEQGDLILKVVPNHVAGMYLRGEGLLLLNNVDDSRVLFTKAATSERSSRYSEALGRANEAKAAVSGEMKFQAPAIDAYKTAIAIDDKNSDAYAGLARMYMLQKEYKQALPPLGKAYEVDKTNLDVMSMIGLAYFNLRDGDDSARNNSITWFKLARSANRDSTVASMSTMSYHLGRMYEEKNSLAEAASALDDATTRAEAEDKKTGKMQPWYAEAQYFRGRVHNALNHIDQARDAWTKWIGQNPPSSDPRLGEVRNALATGLQKR